jgi:chromosome segregation ATPase
VIKKRKRGPRKEKGAAVPISDPREIRELKKSFPTVPKGKLTNSQLIQMAQQQQQGPVASVPKFDLAKLEKEPEEEKGTKLRLAPDPLKIELPPTAAQPDAGQKAPASLTGTITDNLKAAKWQKAQETIERLEQENANLKEALQQAQSSPAKDDAASSPAPAPQMTEVETENADLKRRIEEERARYDDLDKKFAIFKNEFDHLKSLEWAKEEALQGQIVKLKEENEELAKTKEAMERRKAELDSLQKANRQYETDLQRTLDELNGLKTSHAALTAQYKESQASAFKLKEDMVVAKLTLEQKLSDATDKLMSLQSARENAKEKDLNAEERGILEQLRRDNEALIKAGESIKEEFAKIKGMNDQLREREKILQYELTKSRAQAIGLEKICASLKEQVETMNKVSHEG